MIGGFEEPTRGTIYLRGRDVTDLPPYKRDVNTVSSPTRVPAPERVRERGVRAAEEEGRQGRGRLPVKESMRLVDLMGFETRRPSQMSVASSSGLRSPERS